MTQNAAGRDSPNPFNNQLTLNYSLENNSDVKIELIDFTGRPILLLSDESLVAGEHQFVLNGVNGELQNGTYLIKITSETASQVVRVTFVK